MTNIYKHLKIQPSATNNDTTVVDYITHKIYESKTEFLYVYISDHSSRIAAGLSIQSGSLYRKILPSLKNGEFRSKKEAMLYALGFVLESSSQLPAEMLLSIHEAISQNSQTQLF